MKTVKILAKGRVQGVFYRYSTKQEAIRLGVLGYAKNLLNGDVEIIAQGNSDAIQALFLWCKEGPAHARVDDIEIKEVETNKEYNDFKTM